MQVNGKSFAVYPLFETMVAKNYSQQARTLIDQVFEGKSLPISRRVLLYHYMDSVIKNIPSL